MKKIFFIILSFLFFDLVLSQFILLDLITKKNDSAHQQDIENRIFNKNYWYTFKKNKTFNSIYRGRRYIIHTNNLGFRDSMVKEVDRSKNYSIIIGDSFVEGVTVDYGGTIVGVLNKKLGKKIKSFEFLNAGISSYSSYIYLKKIKTILIENPWLKVDSVFVFLDKSDIHNDSKYEEFKLWSKGIKLEERYIFIDPKFSYQNKRKEDFKKDLRSLNMWRFYSKQTVSGLLIKIIGDRIEFFIRDIRDRFKLSKKLDKSFFEITKSYTDALRSINSFKFYRNYFYGEQWNTIGKKSAEFSIKNLVELKQFLNNRNIKMVAVLYPWAYELVESTPRENYLIFMEEALNKNNIEYITLYDKLLSGNVYLNISKNFIFDDVHYNSNGYELIANFFFEQLY